MKCLYCNSENLEKGIALRQDREPAYKIGLAYKYGVFSHSSEQLYVDLCLSCKSVVRIYVKEDIPNRDWKKD